MKPASKVAREILRAELLPGELGHLDERALRQAIAQAILTARREAREAAQAADCWLCQEGIPMKAGSAEYHDCWARKEWKKWRQFEKCKATAIRALDIGET